jgi:hypothetical protein
MHSTVAASVRASQLSCVTWPSLFFSHICLHSKTMICPCVGYIATIVFETRWDLIPQTSALQSNALPTELYQTVVNLNYLNVVFIKIYGSNQNPASHALDVQFSYGACEYMIATPQNIDNLGSYIVARL